MNTYFMGEFKMEYGIFSANEWLYPDTSTKTGNSDITLFAAKNSYACVQILLTDVQNGVLINWESENALNAPEINRLLRVYVEKNTGERGFTVEQGSEVPYATRIAPFWVFDAMKPASVASEFPDDDGIVALYLRWDTVALNAGSYSGSLHIGSETINVSITIANVTIPVKENLRLTNWFSIENMATYHGAELWSSEHWKQIEKYGSLMREARQTDFQVPFSLVSYIKENNNYTFDFSKAERFIRLYLSLGFQYIEGDTPILRECWDAKSFIVTINDTKYPVLSEDGQRFIKSFFSGWYDVLKENNWLDIVSQHVGDEPHADCVDEYNILVNMVKKWMPGVPIIEAVEVPEIEGVDIIVPKNNSYIERQEEYEQKRKSGKTLWFYTCCCPGGKYLNRLLDQELLRTRYLHWANKLYNMNGYLHWGLNHFGFTDDPFKGHAGVIETLNKTALPCGDSHIVYPLGKQVLRSVRFEMMRAGSEDYELLKILENQNTFEYKHLITKCIKSFTDYSVNIELFECVYFELLKKLEDKSTN